MKDSTNNAFVDFQHDVGVKDIELAHREGFRSVEHLKRYSTLGMATDQGKLANVLGLAILADISDRSINKTSTTIFGHHTPRSQLLPLQAQSRQKI